jgi:hypothetical protein
MEIVSIILRLKYQEIKVSIDEAKELFGQLSAVLGGVIKEKEYVPYPGGCGLALGGRIRISQQSSTVTARLAT